MEYGLRRYEATQRLLWFVFFIVCLAFAFPASMLFQGGPSEPPSSSLAFQPEALGSVAFWTKMHLIRQEPLGDIIVYLITVAVLFVLGRFVWLIVQFAGKYFAKTLLSDCLGRPPGRPAVPLDGSKVNLERLFPSKLLLMKANRFPLQIVFHPFQRLRLMLSNPDQTFSSEGLIEKERRIAETDWQILWSSWAPFRWLIWSLPVIALAQSAWLFYMRLQPAISGQKEVQDALGPIFGSLLPLVQVVLIAILFNMISGLIRRIENLYLSNVDSLFYDQFLSRLPFQSSDTLILLEALQRHFQELHSILKRIEATSLVDDRGSRGPQRVENPGR